MGFMLMGCLALSTPCLYAGGHDADPAPPEYVGEDTPQVLQISAVNPGAARDHGKVSNVGDAGHVVKARGRGPIHAAGPREVHKASGSPSHEAAGHETPQRATSAQEAEHGSGKAYGKSESTRTGYGKDVGERTGFSTGTWATLIAGMAVMGLLLFFLMKGTKGMKNLKLGTKIIGMVSIILVLMVISNGFGIIKIGDVGEEIKGIAEEDIPLTGVVMEITVNQLEQAIWFERALRFGEVLATKEAAREGLKSAKEAFNERTQKVDEMLKHGEEMARHGAGTAKTDKAREEFVEIDESLKTIEKHHAGYEHHVMQAFALIGQGKIHEAEELAQKIEKEEEALTMNW